MKHILLLTLLVVGITTYAQPDIYSTSIMQCDEQFPHDDGIAIFDLSMALPNVLGTLDPSLHSIAFYESQVYAENQINPIPNTTNYSNSISPFTQTLYIRVWENADVSSYSIAEVNLAVEIPPLLGTASYLVVQEDPYDGYATFDLTANNTAILNGIDPATVYINYFTNITDAQLNVNPIATANAFNNTANPQPIFVRVENSVGCDSIANFNLHVIGDFIFIPDENFKQKLISLGLDTSNDGEIQQSEALAVTSLDVSNSIITNLEGIQYFTNLQELICNDNLLTSLNVSQNENLNLLNCSDNQLNAIIGIENLTNLLELNVFQNLLSGLELTNASNLETLICGYNQLTSLDISQNPNLQTLYCDNNLLTTLNCSNNVRLTLLSLVNNPNLETVYIKNGSDESINIDSGSWLENWFSGNNSSLIYVCADDFQIESILAAENPNLNVNSYCSYEPGGDYNTITGTILFDGDENGCNASDFPHPLIRMDIDNGTLQGGTFTNDMGEYTFYTNAGSFDITPNLNYPTYFNISPITANISFPNDNNNETIQDFCVTANGIYNDVEVIIAPIFGARPGFEADYFITYKNNGNQIQTGNINLSFEDDYLDFVSATQTPDNQNTGTLTWNYENLLPFESRNFYLTFQVNAPTDTPPVNIDDVLVYDISINPITGDETPDDNAFVLEQTVVGSYDPNDIVCLEGDAAPTADIGKYLHYVINFENTGNYEAENIVVKVEIDPTQYDMNSMQLLNTSHPAQVKINGNIAEFMFQTIQLESGGHGNILLKIRTINELEEGDTVSKKANIYFDYNFPIETNDADTTFGEQLSVEDVTTNMNVEVYPNPAQDLVSIKAEESIQSIRLFDASGRLLQVVKTDSDTAKIDISNYKKGVYILKISTQKTVETQKIIKL